MALLKTTPAFIEVNGDRLDSSAPFVYTDSAFSKYLLTLYRERNTNVSRVMEAARNELSLALTDILNNLSALDHIPATYKPILRAHIALITGKEAVVKTADIYYAGNVFNDADAYTLSLTNWNTITNNLITPITDDVNDTPLLHIESMVVFLEALSKVFYNFLSMIQQIVWYLGTSGVVQALTTQPVLRNAYTVSGLVTSGQHQKVHPPILFGLLGAIKSAQTQYINIIRLYHISRGVPVPDPEMEWDYYNAVTQLISNITALYASAPDYYLVTGATYSVYKQVPDAILAQMQAELLPFNAITGSPATGYIDTSHLSGIPNKYEGYGLEIQQMVINGGGVLLASDYARVREIVDTIFLELDPYIRLALILADTTTHSLNNPSSTLGIGERQQSNHHQLLIDFYGLIDVFGSSLTSGNSTMYDYFTKLPVGAAPTIVDGAGNTVLDPIVDPILHPSLDFLMTNSTWHVEIVYLIYVLVDKMEKVIFSDPNAFWSGVAVTPEVTTITNDLPGTQITPNVWATYLATTYPTTAEVTNRINQQIAQFSVTPPMFKGVPMADRSAFIVARDTGALAIPVAVEVRNFMVNNSPANNFRDVEWVNHLIDIAYLPASGVTELTMSSYLTSHYPIIKDPVTRQGWLNYLSAYPPTIPQGVIAAAWYIYLKERKPPIHWNEGEWLDYLESFPPISAAQWSAYLVANPPPLPSGANPSDWDYLLANVPPRLGFTESQWASTLGQYLVFGRSLDAVVTMEKGSEKPYPQVPSYGTPNFTVTSTFTPLPPPTVGILSTLTQGTDIVDANVDISFGQFANLGITPTGTTAIDLFSSYGTYMSLPAVGEDVIIKPVWDAYSVPYVDYVAAVPDVVLYDTAKNNPPPLTNITVKPIRSCNMFITSNASGSNGWVNPLRDYLLDMQATITTATGSVSVNARPYVNKAEITYPAGVQTTFTMK